MVACRQHIKNICQCGERGVKYKFSLLVYIGPIIYVCDAANAMDRWTRKICALPEGNEKIGDETWVLRKHPLQMRLSC
jgi:hypothetical protein